jgi:hypothetical protein
LAIECMRDLLKLDQIVGENIAQALVEGDISIPEAKLPVARILDITGQAIISSKEIIQDKVMVEGVLQYDILYITEGEEQVEAVEAEIGFTQYLDIPGARPKMLSWLDLRVEHIDCEILSGKRLSLQAVIRLYGKVRETLELESVRGFIGVNDVEVLRDRVEATSSAGEGRTQTMLSEDLDLVDSMPSIQRILRKNLSIKIKEHKVMDNKVVVSGVALIKLLYQADNEEDPLHFVDHEIEFSHAIDMPGAYQGMGSNVSASVIDFYADPREDINGEFRIIDTEAIINLEASVYEPLELDIITDAYSPSLPMTLNKKTIVLSQLVAEGEDQLVVKEGISFPPDKAKARKILYVDVNPLITDESIGDGKVNLEGILSVVVLYQSKDADMLLSSFADNIAFSHSIDLDQAVDGQSCKSKVSVDKASFVLLAQDELEIKVVLSLATELEKKIEKQIIIGAEALDQAEAVDSGIYIYFVQPGDSLWTIAKKYNTTASIIEKFNDLGDEARLEPGTRLVIYKKLDSPAV